MITVRNEELKLLKNELDQIKQQELEMRKNVGNLSQVLEKKLQEEVIMYTKELFVMRRRF